MGFKLFWRVGSVTALTITALVFAGHWAVHTLAQIKPPESEILPFIGTWTAVHAGTPIIGRCRSIGKTRTAITTIGGWN